MGTYTTNYNLFMPTVGEQGWGDLVNGNFTTIDTTMKGLNTRVGTLETETTTLDGKVTTLEPLSIIQVDENQTVTFPANVNVGDAINAGTVTADLSPCFDVISGNTNEIGAILLTTSKTLTSRSNSAGTTAQTFTYRANPICNTVTFSCSITSNESRKSGSSVVQVNGVAVCSASVSTNTTSNNSANVTLNDGDVISASVYAQAVSVSGSNTMTCSVYPIKPSL